MKSGRWWQQKRNPALDEALSHINQARVRDNPVDQLRDLCDALNKAWDAYRRYRRNHGQLTETEKERSERGESPPDNQAVTQLLLTGLGDEAAVSFCRSSALEALAGFTPQVMNHGTLRRRNYDPAEISEGLRKKATEEHQKLKNAHGRYVSDPTKRELQGALLKKAAALLYVIRSNTQHGEKTLRGPDLEKAERDQKVAGTACAAIEQIFSSLLAMPETRLAVYGTLSPGQANAEILSKLEGHWQDAVVPGEVVERGGLPIFRWDTSGGEVNVKVLTSPALPDHLKALDTFEGAEYKRILVPAMTSDGLMVVNIYEGTSLT